MQEAAQSSLNTRALELAQEAVSELRSHKREDEIHFGHMREHIDGVASSVSELRDKMEEDKREIIGAIQSLRKEESSTRKDIYSRFDARSTLIITGLFVVIGSLVGWIAHMKWGI